MRILSRVLIFSFFLFETGCVSEFEDMYQPGIPFGPNTTPNISGITVQSTGINTSKSVRFMVSDPLGILSCNSTFLSMTSSNLSIVENSGVTWGGTVTGGCTALIAPITGRMGVTTITITVDDGTTTTSQSFLLNVKSIGGAGTVGAVTQSAALSGIEALQITSGDFNGDTYPDIAVTSNGAAGTIDIYLNNQAGGFTATSSKAFGARAYGVKAADLNGDGRTDLICRSGGNVGVLIGNGNGTFVNPVNYAVGGGGAGGGGIDIADFNQDGKTDVIAATSVGMKILLGVGDGTLQASSLFSAVLNFMGVTTGDFNQDGFKDVAAVVDDQRVYLYFGTGNGTFSAGTLYAAPVGGAYVEFIDASDIDGDGDLDLLSANYNGNTVYPYKNNGSGVFTVQAGIATGNAPGDCKAVDMDDDAVVDLVCSNYADSTLTIKKGHNDFTFTGGSTPSAGGGAWGLVADDFNRDGKTDIAIADYSDGKFGFVFGN